MASASRPLRPHCGITDAGFVNKHATLRIREKQTRLRFGGIAFDWERLRQQLEVCLLSIWRPSNVERLRGDDSDFKVNKQVTFFARAIRSSYTISDFFLKKQIHTIWHATQSNFDKSTSTSVCKAAFVFASVGVSSGAANCNRDQD